MKHCDIAIIGAGPAGLAAAVAAHEAGVKDILVIERDSEPGGILNQCIHNGFGLHRFGVELTGPEYAGRYEDMLIGTGVKIQLGTMVIGIENRVISCVSKENGYEEISAGAIVLAMGCRERNRGPIFVPGDRGSGVFSAGSAQRYLNIEGYLVGRRVVILGSGDIGLIMARRMTLEGAKVLAVSEIMPFSNGLSRNIAQCLDDFGIPLYLSHTVTDIIGKGRVEAVVISQVDESMKPIPGTEKRFECDTLLLSVGLVPENELSRAAGIKIDPRTNGPVVGEDMQTSADGVFACGNVLHVHDLVDYVSAESARAGAAAAEYVLRGGNAGGECLPVTASGSVGYTVPQSVCPQNVGKALDIFFRVRKKIRRGEITVTSGGTVIASFKREFLAPAEMQKITVPKALLEKASGGLNVSVTETESEAE